MNQYFLELNIDKQSILQRDYIKPTKIINYIKWESIDYLKSIFTIDFLNTLSKVSEIAGALVFYKRNQQTPHEAHTDIAVINEKVIHIPYGMNIVFDDSNDIQSKMCWYSFKDNLQKDEIKYSPAGVAYLTHPIKNLVLEQEHTISDKVTLVRTDVPHAIISGNGLRTCISIRFKSFASSWKEGYELFNEAFNQ